MSNENLAVMADSDEANLRRRQQPAKLLQVAIDGPAGAGKSTVAKRVADLLGYLYIDTGAMYRAITWLAVEHKVKISDRDSISALAATARIELRPGDSPQENLHVLVNGTEITKAIRTPQVTKLVSSVAAIPSVREHLVEQQRILARPGGVVLDGRDIGTVVLPDADLKIFLTASADVRANRRMAELSTAGEKVDYQLLLKQIIERDHKDSNRVIAPLRMADDAVLILTDNMTIDEVVSHVVKLCGE
jgi:pantoate ligase/cytidylate kinase